MISPAAIDPPELDDILWQGFGPGHLGFDIGANCGQTLNKIADRFENVIAFEPSVEALEYLEEYYGSMAVLTIEKYAVSSVSGTIDLMAAPSKISTGQLVTHGTAGMEWSEDEMQNGEIRTIPSITLDDYTNFWDLKPDFLKIDVEGHEMEVLTGASRVLDVLEPEMLIEVHSEFLGEEIRRLLGSTHSLEVVRHPHYAPESLLWRTHFWYRCFPLHR